jgi:hypothetical protein
MNYVDLVEEFGNASRAAKALGYSRQALSRWRSAGIPFESQYRIELKLRGKLKAQLPEQEAATV